MDFTCLQDTFSTRKEAICKNRDDTFTKKAQKTQYPTEDFTQVKQGPPLIYITYKIVIINRIIQQRRTHRLSLLYTQLTQTATIHNHILTNTHGPPNGQPTLPFAHIYLSNIYIKSRIRGEKLKNSQFPNRHVTKSNKHKGGQKRW
jgi:hypothetical protein